MGGFFERWFGLDRPSRPPETGRGRDAPPTLDDHPLGGETGGDATTAASPSPAGSPGLGAAAAAAGGALVMAAFAEHASDVAEDDGGADDGGADGGGADGGDGD